MTISTNPVVPVIGDLVTLSSTIAGTAPTTWIVTSQPKGALLFGGSAANVADYAALRRVVGPTNKESRLVASTGELFEFSAKGGAGVADDGATIIRPNSVPLATAGRWYLGGTTGSLRDATGVSVATFTPTKAGEYGFEALHRNYVYDGTGARLEDTPLTSVETTTVHVGAVATLPILTRNGQGAVLRLVVQNETVKEATLVDWVDEASRIATLDATAVAALAALEDVAVSGIGSSLQTVTTDLRTNYIGHIALTAGSVHLAADTVATIERYPANTTAYAVDLLNELYDKCLAHAQQGVNYAYRVHANDDGKNVPVAAKATDLASATVLAADLRERFYERHRVQVATPAVHGGTGDSTYVLTAPSLLDNLIVAYLDALVSVGSAASGEPEGAFDLANTFGFRVAA